uniref:SPRY-associated domain-containing protein n=1 Tax=Salmo trutta TaxID=8032 RepID=A0A674BHQ0_SALTR
QCIDISPLSRLAGCKITYESSCETLASALQTPNCPLRELDLSDNDLGDRGVELLCVGLTSPLCNIQTLVLGQCGLTEGCCSVLASVLSSPNSQLKQLELRDNDLQDSGVTLLSAGLEDPINYTHWGKYSCFSQVCTELSYTAVCWTGGSRL